MKTLKAVVAKYNQTSLILRILIGLAVGSVLALVAPGAGWVGELGSLFVGALKALPGAGRSSLWQARWHRLVQAGPPLWHRDLAVYAHHLSGGSHCGHHQLYVPGQGGTGRCGTVRCDPAGLGEVLSTLLTNFVANPVSA